MKFVCDNCDTKYTIADEKVRRKVLKIRCKNCSNIIVVRERSELSRLEPERTGEGRPPDFSFDGGFRTPGGRRSRASQNAPALKVSAAPMASPELEEMSAAEPTRLSTFPDMMPAEGTPPPPEDEWYLAVEGNQFGPMAFAELCSRVRRGEAQGEAYVWRDGFDDWLEPHEVPEIKPYLPRHPPPPPPRGKSGLFPSPSMPLVPPMPPAAPRVATPYVPSPVLPRSRLPTGNLSGAPLPPAPQPAPPAGSTLPPPTYVRGSTLPPGTQATSLPGLTPGQGLLDTTGPVSPGDSGLQSLPLSPATTLPPGLSPGEPGGYVLTPAGPSVRPTSSTPLLLKITAGAGIASLLCGIGLVTYFIFWDGPDKPSRTAVPVPVVEHEPPPVAPTAPAAKPPEAPLEFQPMEIGRSARAHPARSAGSGRKAQPKPAPAPSLDEKQRRLLALYGKGETKAAAPPAVEAPARQAAGPRRQISSNDILAMQRKHRPALTACYDRALKRDESLAELKADVTVTIDNRGLVKSVDFQGVRDEELAACMRKNIRHWVFEPVGEQTFRFPIIFRGT